MRNLRWMGMVVLVVGCSRPAADGRSGDGGVPADSARAGSAPGAAVADSAPAAEGDASRWRLSEEGIGPVRVGMTIDEVRAALGGELEVGKDLDDGEEGCRYAMLRSPAGVGVMFERRRVVRVDVDTATVPTTRGVRVGDTEERVRQAYGDVRVEPHKYTAGSYLIVLPRAPADTLRRLVFETDSATRAVTRFRGGVFPPVEYVEGCA